MNSPILSRQACNALRGLAIIGIFLHNYCHWLGPIVKENEYQYFQHNVDWLAQVMVNPNLNLPIHLLSFFGHYGVPVFLFLSAYGLVMKYEAKPHLDANQEAQMYSISGKKQVGLLHFNWREPLRFVRYHYLKLFKMMIVGFVAFTMIDYITRPLLVLRLDAATLHRLSPPALSPPLGMDRRTDGDLHRHPTGTGLYRP